MEIYMPVCVCACVQNEIVSMVLLNTLFNKGNNKRQNSHKQHL